MYKLLKVLPQEMLQRLLHLQCPSLAVVLYLLQVMIQLSLLKQLQTIQFLLPLPPLLLPKLPLLVLHQQPPSLRNLSQASLLSPTEMEVHLMVLSILVAHPSPQMFKLS